MSEKFKDKYRIPSARLQGWDYGSNAAYFVTICTHLHECYFGDIVDGEMILNEMGQLANKFWMEIPQHFQFVILDSFIVMPNHVHGIIVIDKMENVANAEDGDVTGDIDVTGDVETLHATSLQVSPHGKNEYMASISPKSGSLSTIIRSYKSVVSKYARQIHADFAWQSRFHDHIIRNDESYQRIVDYIHANPKKWCEDKFFKETM